MRDRMQASGAIKRERLDEALTLPKLPDFWAFAGAGVAVWGQRPA